MKKRQQRAQSSVTTRVSEHDDNDNEGYDVFDVVSALGITLHRFEIDVLYRNQQPAHWCESVCVYHIIYEYMWRYVRANEPGAVCVVICCVCTVYRGLYESLNVQWNIWSNNNKHTHTRNRWAHKTQNNLLYCWPRHTHKCIRYLPPNRCGCGEWRRHW